MNTENTALLNLCCQICAIIYVHEVSHKGWPGLLDSLVNVLDKVELEWPNLAAINTLGQICDLLDSRRIPISTPDHQNIITGLLFSISANKPHDEVKIVGFKALTSSVCYHETIYEEKKVIASLFESVLHALESSNRQLCRSALEFLNEGAKVLYEHLPALLPRITPIIVQIMKQEESSGHNLPVIATEFWTSLSKEEVYRRKNGRVAFLVTLGRCQLDRQLLELGSLCL